MSKFVMRTAGGVNRVMMSEMARREAGVSPGDLVSITTSTGESVHRIVNISAKELMDEIHFKSVWVPFEVLQLLASVPHAEVEVKRSNADFEMP